MKLPPWVIPGFLSPGSHSPGNPSRRFLGALIFFSSLPGGQGPLEGHPPPAGLIMLSQACTLRACGLTPTARLTSFPFAPSSPGALSLFCQIASMLLPRGLCTCPLPKGIPCHHAASFHHSKQFVLILSSSEAGQQPPSQPRVCPPEGAL